MTALPLVGVVYSSSVSSRSPNRDQRQVRLQGAQTAHTPPALVALAKLLISAGMEA